LQKTQITRIFALLLAAAAPAWAVETKPPAAAPTHNATEATPQARAFLALPQADRKAAQEALGWLGFYNGVDDGAFGKRTIEALSAYQKSVGSQADGIITANALAALEDGAAKAKAAVGFRLVDDPATGVHIGAPTRLLEKRDNGTGTTGLTSKDGSVALSLKETKGDLAGLYKTLAVDAGSRKVTYKYLKPDAFFVTAGEDGDNKFYRRYAVSGDKLRGFAFVYPKKREKALDPVALAIANSFDPFPATAPAPSPSPAPTPQAPKLAATALVVAPGVAVTALDPAQCKAPMVAGKPARFLDGQGPLARLSGEFGAGAAAPPLGRSDGELVALVLRGGAPKPTLAVSLARGAPGGAGKVIGAFAPSASGAPLFDRRGGLVGFVAASPASPFRAGVALDAPHAIIPASALGAAGSAGGAGGASLTAAEIARLRRSAIVGVFCPA
jgi:hypothetical protein